MEHECYATAVVPMPVEVEIEIEMPVGTGTTASQGVRAKAAVEHARTRQSELARAVGLSPSHVCLILRGARVPSLPVAKKIADYLGITLDELYGEVVTAN